MTLPEGAQGIIGKHYRQLDHFLVGREKIREFAQSIKDENPVYYSEAAATEAGYPAVLAPLTFLAIAGRRVQLEIFTKFSIPINIARVMHRDQKFKFHRPIMVGDELHFDTYLDSVIQSHGTVLAEIRSEVTDAEGKPVVTSVVTMLGEAAQHDSTAEATVAAIASI
jgi:acyl dehydratase